MNWIHELLQNQTVILLFLIMGLGMLIGRIRIGGTQLGAVTGVLMIGLIAGHRGYSLPANTDNLGFLLFIYCVGAQAGPQFFSAFKTDGLKYAALAVVTAVTATALARLATSLFEFDYGITAGLLAGALTSTPTLVAAQDAVGQLDALPAGFTQAQALGNVGAAYAITYVFGLGGLILLMAVLPRLLHMDLPKEAKEYGEGTEIANRMSAEEYIRRGRTPVIRAYRVEKEDLLGPPREHADYSIPGEIQRIKRGTEVWNPSEDDELELGDIISMVGLKEAHRFAREKIGPEIVDDEVMDRSMVTRRIMISSREVEGKTLGDLDIHKNYDARVTGVRRSGVNIPRRPDLVLQTGDILTVTGNESTLNTLSERLGFVENDLEETDMLALAFGIALGVALGTLTLRLAGAAISLGSAGGVLLIGLVFGLIHSRRPTWGRLPGGARYILMELGLLLFMASVAINAGGSLVETLKREGPILPLCGAAITLIPALICFFAGKYVFRLNGAILLGAVTGSMTSTAALQQITAQAKSTVPTLGYVGTYAFANVLLTVAGGAIMRL